MYDLSAQVDAQVEVQQGPSAEAFVQGLPPAASILADAHLLLTLFQILPRATCLVRKPLWPRKTVLIYFGKGWPTMSL
jgi:hypothetical protein